MKEVPVMTELPHQIAKANFWILSFIYSCSISLHSKYLGLVGSVAYI